MFVIPPSMLLGSKIGVYETKTCIAMRPKMDLMQDGPGWRLTTRIIMFYLIIVLCQWT